jgi:hypothetical protein
MERTLRRSCEQQWVRFRRAARLRFAVVCICGSIAAAAGAGAEIPAPPAVPGVRGSAVRCAVPTTIVGHLEVHDGISSPLLPEPRRLFVLLPESYDPAQHYPVVYAFDGEDLFDAATAAGGDEWSLDEFLAAHPAGIPALIVVGVEAGADARREYGPPGSVDGAKGEAFSKLMIEVVEPFVKAHYSIISGPAGARVLGAGGAALMALYLAWTHPDHFGGAVAIDLPDPGDWSVADAVRTGATPKTRPRLWIDQSAGDVTQRPSTTQLLTELETGATVQYVLAGPRATQIGRVAAGLRAVLVP